jgi:chromosome segregation ATPase
MVGDRFPRGTGEGGSGGQTAVADVLVTGIELLDRIERQAEETARLRVRLDAVESALDAERKTRRRMGEMLEREREARTVLDGRLEAEREARVSAEDQLEQCEAAAVKLHEQVKLTWAQLGIVERELAWARRPLWRKALRRPAREETG